MSRIFFVGDFKSENGPAIANKATRKGLENENGILYSDAISKVGRIIELIIKTLLCKYIVFCSSSQLNVYAIKFSKLLNKKIFYIMHGYESYEYKMNNNNIEDDKYRSIKKYEKFIFENSDKIFCVSKTFMDFMIENESKYKYKFDYNFNGVNLDELKKLNNKSTEKNIYQIVSIGGGMKRKNNIAVCKAISIINERYNLNLKYIVIGAEGTDKDEICKYDFVEYYEKLTHTAVIEIMNKSKIYIQNSYFETFGISILEALYSGCDCLVSQYVGSKDLLNNIEENDIIFNPDDYNEIAIKILNIFKIQNNKKLIENFREDIVLPLNSSNQLLKKINQI